MHTTYSIETNRAKHTFNRLVDHQAYIAIAVVGTSAQLHKFFASIEKLNSKTFANAKSMGLQVHAKVGTLNPNAKDSDHTTRMSNITGSTDKDGKDCPFSLMLLKIKKADPLLKAHIFCFPLSPICCKVFNPVEAEAMASELCAKKFKLTPTNKDAHFNNKKASKLRRKLMPKFNSNPFE